MDLAKWEEQYQTSGGSAGSFKVDGRRVEVSDGSDYMLSVLNIPFPSEGRHTAVVEINPGDENCGIGLGKSFDAIKAQSQVCWACFTLDLHS
eukprot:SAG11_NODE_1446_length_4891_cov_1.703673_3_plen_92_part_00